ncbi:ABC transporter substrate-binding protein [Bradyrhizobium sp. 31Argb]
MRISLAISFVCGLIGLATTSAQATNLHVLYAFDRTTAQAHQEIKERFEKENPGITVEFLAAAPNYEDASQSIIRNAMIGDLPDVTFQGLNLVRGLVDRGIAVPLDPFIAGDGGADKLGYDAGMLRVGSVNGKTFGIPFAVSTPLLYVNADLVRAAGVEMDAFPTRWEDIVALGKKIDDPARNIIGFYFQWDITGNWMFQSLLFANGGSMMSFDEKAIAFDQPPGLAALATLELFAKARMPNLPTSQARPAFMAGKIGIFADSSSNLGAATRQIAKSFEMRTLCFPLGAAGGRLPAGGNLAVMLSKDPEKQAAAWQYIKFATGPIGQTIMARHTGYLPSNSVAIKTPELLGDFYKANTNFQASIAQIPILTGWYAFPGPNAVKIIDVIKRHSEAVVTGKKSAAETMPSLVADVRKLLE